MTSRNASCSCGQLSVVTEGEPVRISVCHCLACQRRTGSVFGAQARFPDENVRISGEAKHWSRIGDGGTRIHFSFCPECGSTVFYRLEAVPGFTAVALGAFADPAFPPPTVSVYDVRRHPWVTLDASIEHLD